MNSYDRAHRNLGSLEASQGNSGYDGPKLGHEKPRYSEQHLPTLQHEAFLRWLKVAHPERDDCVALGIWIPPMLWQSWLAEWYALPPDDTFTQLWRSLNRASRDKLYAEASPEARKVYDELNAAFPVEE